MAHPWDRPRQIFIGEYSVTSIIVTISLAIALYNTIELCLLILLTFKRWRGLYFWSMSGSNLGVVLYCLGMLIEYFQLTSLWLSKTSNTIGWIMMITGQSLVLYSRLGLILQSQRILRAVKWMIILNGVAWYPTCAVLDFGTSYAKDKESFAKTFFYVEQVQMTCISLQELIISSLYVWKTLAYLKGMPKDNIRSVISQLFVINVIIIGMDVALLYMEYSHWKLWQQCIKAFIYSVKLKLELNILSKLVALVEQKDVMVDDVDFITDPTRKDAGDLQNKEHAASTLQRSQSNDKGSPCHIEDINVDRVTRVEAPHELSSPPVETPPLRKRRSSESVDLYAQALRSIK